MKRRDFIGSLAALAATPHVGTTDPLIWSFTRGMPVLPGRVKLELPALAENGYSVAMTVTARRPTIPNPVLGSTICE